MKEFKLIAWPELPESYQEVAYTKALEALSEDFISERQLQLRTGIPAPELRALLKFLAAEDLLDGRDLEAEAAAAAAHAPHGWLSWLRRRH